MKDNTDNDLILQPTVPPCSVYNTQGNIRLQTYKFREMWNISCQQSKKSKNNCSCAGLARKAAENGRRSSTCDILNEQNRLIWRASLTPPECYDVSTTFPRVYLFGLKQYFPLGFFSGLHYPCPYFYTVSASIPFLSQPFFVPNLRVKWAEIMEHIKESFFSSNKRYNKLSKTSG